MRTHMTRRLIAAAAIITGLGVVPVLSPTAASASGSSLHVSGPTSNSMGMNFNETISGFAASPANYVVAWEQFYKHSGCASTFAQESTRAFFASTYGLTVWFAQSVTPGSHYATVAHFGAANLGTHGMCSYLINLSTGTTYAHGGIWWNNHN